MSLCHSWLGFDRSKKRGLGGLRGVFFFAFGISPCRCSVFRTVSGLAFTNSARLSHWLIRFTPKLGCCRFTSAIFRPSRSLDGGGALLAGDRSFRPSSPPSRYRRTHFDSTLLWTPNSPQISFAGSPSSRNSFTALRRTSADTMRRFFPAPEALRPFWAFFSPVSME
jgi:hypothetical protein